jgi:hypothetical protein
VTNLREGAIIVSLIDALNQRGSFCGETHVQKGAYFLRELTGVPLESPFTLYLYGPYSFSLHELLNQLRAEELVQLEPRAMGASWRPGERYHLLKKTFPTTLSRVQRQVEFVADKVARLGVVDLEPLATALYVTRAQPSQPRDERARALRAIKTRVDDAAARQAVDTIDAWLGEVVVHFPPRML